jgi:hypothetical protein
MAISRPIAEKLEALTKKIVMLLDSHEEIQLKLQTVQEKNQELTTIVEKQREALKKFQNQAKISNIVGATESEIADIQAIKVKIDTCIAEIDHCINTLTEQ